MSRVRLLSMIAVGWMIAGCAAADPASAPAPARAAREVKRDSVYDVKDATTKPELKNRSVVARALQGAYPRALRDAGLQGSTELTVGLDEQGRIAALVVRRSSGYPEMDAAAREVFSKAEFTPAKIGDIPVRVRMNIPISFTLEGLRSSSPPE
ncbi:MAG: energy transducer TonB [Chloroflexota bacterium]|nr:energy transducer TonB [Chloroflexota bacterium]